MFLCTFSVKFLDYLDLLLNSNLISNNYVLHIPNRIAIIDTCIYIFRCLSFENGAGFIFTPDEVKNCIIIVCDGDGTFYEGAENLLYKSILHSKKFI